MSTSFDKQKLLTNKQNLCTITHTILHILLYYHLFFVLKQRTEDFLLIFIGNMGKTKKCIIFLTNYILL